MNEINVRNEILDSIDNVNEITMESTLDVFGSLTLAFEKAAMITEYSNVEDLSMFSIFQEAEVAAGDANANAEAKKDSIGYKIIHFIPNILKKIWEFIKQAWNGEIVPTAKAAAKEAESLTDKAKSLINKILGKDESWIRENAGVLGLGAGALALALGIVGWFNRDNLKKLMTDFINGISKFFKKTGDSAKQYGVIFEMVVWNKFKTNVSFKGLKDAITSVPEFFRKCKEFHLRNINPLVNQAGATSVNPVQMLTDLSNLEKELDQMSAADIIVQDIAELSGSEIIEGFTLTDPDSEVGQNINKSLAETAKVFDLTDEQIKRFQAAFPADKQGTANTIFTKIAGWLKNAAEAFFGMLKSAKDFCANFIKKVKDAKAIDNQLKDEYKVPEEGAEEKAATDDLTQHAEEDVADANADELSDALADNLDNSSSSSSDNRSSQSEDDIEPAVNMDQHVDDVPEGEEAVQESAVEELSEADIEINNHWYR